MTGMMVDALRQSLLSLLAGKSAKKIETTGLFGVVDGDMKTGVPVAVPVPKGSARDLHTTMRITI